MRTIMDTAAIVEQFNKMRQAVIDHYDKKIEDTIQSLLAERENLLRGIEANIELLSNPGFVPEQPTLFTGMSYATIQQPISLINAVESILPNLPDVFTINEVIALINQNYPEHRNPNPTSISGILRKLISDEEPLIVRLKKGKGRMPSYYQVSRAVSAHENLQEEDVQEAIPA